MLKYREIMDGIFLEFPNHFIAYVGVNGTVETALRELSEPMPSLPNWIFPRTDFCRLRAAYIKYFVLPKDML